MPRWRSSPSESVWVLPSSTLPISSMTPAAWSSRSVRVVLPASTCASIPKFNVRTARHVLRMRLGGLDGHELAHDVQGRRSERGSNPVSRTLALGIPLMRPAAPDGTIFSMIETATSVTVIHGAMLSFETVEARDADSAPVRMREDHETLLRVIDGTVTLELAGTRADADARGRGADRVGDAAPDLERRTRRCADRAGVPPNLLGALRQRRQPAPRALLEQALACDGAAPCRCVRRPTAPRRGSPTEQRPRGRRRAGRPTPARRRTGRPRRWCRAPARAQPSTSPCARRTRRRRRRGRASRLRSRPPR